MRVRTARSCPRERTSPGVVPRRRANQGGKGGRWDTTYNREKLGGPGARKVGRGLPGHSSQKATVGVLAGRNPALPGALSGAEVSSEDFPHVKKKKKKDDFIKNNSIHISTSQQMS